MSRIITPVICIPDRMRVRAERLAKYCRALDGTEIKLIRFPQEELTFPSVNRMPNIQARALHYAAEQMNGQPFLWLEPDSIPLAPGWAQKLTDEYVEAGKPFMLSGDRALPGDFGGAIGIYPVETHWMLPKTYQEHTWDKFIFDRLPDLTHFSPRLQHSYGVYEGMICTREHRFVDGRPDWFRPEALIFHRDKHQDLIGPRDDKDTRTFFHSGDLGDIIAALPIIRHLGGGKLYLGATEPCKCRENMTRERFEFIRPLLESAPYIWGVEYEDEARADYDFSEFRSAVPRIKRASLVEWQARSFDIDPKDVDLSPWLDAIPSPRSKGALVVARSARYHNPSFPWRHITSKYPHVMHVGTPKEHKELVRRLDNRVIEYAKCPDMLVMAQIIRGSDLFIGNQSSPCWIAMAMGHPLMQETWTVEPNSMIERPNAKFITKP